MTAGPATSAPVSWLNRNVLGIGVADLAADANYEMVFAVLPLFITVGLGAPAFAVGVVEGVGDGASSVVKLWSGWYSDRVAWRKRLAIGGYGATVFGLGLLVAIASWPPVIVARALAWMGRGLRQPIRSATPGRYPCARASAPRRFQGASALRRARHSSRGVRASRR